MKKYAYCAVVALALGAGPANGTADPNAVNAAAACVGIPQGPELDACLARNGVQPKALGFADALKSSFAGVRNSFGSMASSARNQVQGAQASASNFFSGIRKSASNLAYKAMGKEDLHNTAEEGGQFLGALAWWVWAHNASNPFPTCISVAQTMPDTVKASVQKWRNALMDQGISASSKANVDALQSMGYPVVVNSLNLTVITNGDRSIYWRKGPWGWLTCTADGKTIITNRGDTPGKTVRIDQTNEAIASGHLVPMIWNKEASTMEDFSPDNCLRLVDNNLKPFMPQQPARS